MVLVVAREAPAIIPEMVSSKVLEFEEFMDESVDIALLFMAVVVVVVVVGYEFALAGLEAIATAVNSEDDKKPDLEMVGFGVTTCGSTVCMLSLQLIPMAVAR